MSASGTELVVVTQSYPFGIRKDFMEDEIEFLARVFDRVTLVPTSPQGPRQEVPEGVRTDLSIARSSNRLVRLRALFDIRAIRIWLEEVTSSLRYLDPRAFVRLVLAVGQYAVIRRWASSRPRPTVAYTFWLTPATAAMGDEWFGTPVISRAHGGDLFWERHRPPVIPLQRRSVQASMAVASVSERGRQYLCERYPDLADRLTVARLGIRNELGLAPASQDGIVRILSISSLTDVKRPALLASAVSHLADGLPAVEWWHFGDGPLRGDVEEILRSAPRSLKAFLPGTLDHGLLLQRIVGGPWDVFVNVSSSEGVPVSIMEVQSAGIPVVATDVGGTSEVVDRELDILVGEECGPRDVALAIQSALERPESLRSRRREAWMEKFSADTNYRAFAHRLAELGGGSVRSVGED